MPELCSCGHANDHPRKRCLHPNDDGTGCPCEYGMRVDVATFQMINEMMTRQTMILTEIGMNIARLLAVTEHATGFESRVIPDGRGRASIEVKPKIVLAH